MACEVLQPSAGNPARFPGTYGTSPAPQEGLVAAAFLPTFPGYDLYNFFRIEVPDHFPASNQIVIHADAYFDWVSQFTPIPPILASTLVEIWVTPAGPWKCIAVEVGGSNV